MKQIQPKDRAEAVAIFRSEIVGALVRRDLDHGELAAELRRLSEQRFRPPGSKWTRTYAVPTLERWYYALRSEGLEGLRPRPRSDRGRARALCEQKRKLLLDIRREHRSASVPLILKSLVIDGQLDEGVISSATIRRLYREHGLDRVATVKSAPRARLRWQAEYPGGLWHADVCHGPNLDVNGKKQPVRIHGLLDDASRFIVTIEARATEREDDMLAVLVRAIRKHGPPDALYLDNGSTYRGDVLRVACARLGITLLHARPYDPQARGKMERVWRTIRAGCLNYVGGAGSLHDVNVRLWAFVDEHYHRSPHAGLLGRTPHSTWHDALESRPRDEVDERRLRDALTVTERRRVRRDSTLDVRGTTYEVEQAFLAGRVVTIGQCLIDDPAQPWVEHEGKRLPLHVVDVIRNARRARAPVPDVPRDPRAVDFNPAESLLRKATGKSANGGDR